MHARGFVLGCVSHDLLLFTQPPLPLLARAHVTSVITGVGERQEEPAPRKPVVDASKPYLIIDARDTDAYDACHIVGGEWALCVVRNRR